MQQGAVCDIGIGFELTSTQFAYPKSFLASSCDTAKGFVLNLAMSIFAELASNESPDLGLSTVRYPNGMSYRAAWPSAPWSRPHSRAHRAC